MTLKLEKQTEGTALTADELKNLTSLLVKLGYKVRIRKQGNGGVRQTVIEAEETT